MTRYSALWIISVCITFSTYSQVVEDSIKGENLKRIITVLASDSLKGRGNHTSGLHKAAEFIAKEFTASNLSFFPGFTSYLQPFTTEKIDTNILKDVFGRYNPDYVLLNVVGVLPGKSLGNEVVVFSAHYDHLGTNYSETGDNVYNGANDNASGTTALLELVRYYAFRNDNARTLVFCAFAGEELGLLGSDLFSTFIQPNAIKVVINIEMIGRKNIAGKNAFIITGSEYSSVEKIFRNNLKETKMKVLRERDKGKMLFERSDNYPFAKKGIPAHSIMSSDDDDECYHKACDEVKRIDLVNMMEIIKAIIIGCKTIIDGTDTPTRIKGKFS